MAFSLISIYLDYFRANFFKNVFIKFKYLAKKVNFLINNKIIQAFQAIYIKLRLKKVIYIINTLIFSSSAF